jgi:hypothetical protein
MPYKFKPLPPPEELWDLFALNPLTGELFWQNISSSACRPNGLAGSINTAGYVLLKIKKQVYYAHRIVRAWVDGKDPGNTMLDHKDQNKSNNKPWNIRICCDSQNKANINTKKGYCFHPTKNKYQARIRFHKKRLYLGYFDTAEEAHNCYIEAKKRLYGEFAP